MSKGLKAIHGISVKNDLSYQSEKITLAFASRKLMPDFEFFEITKGVVDNFS